MKKTLKDSSESKSNHLAEKIKIFLDPKWKFATTPIFVVCNNYVKLLEIALDVTKEAKSHDVFFQRNPFFSTHMGEGTNAKFNLEQEFNDYCNFFDKHKANTIYFCIKRLIKSSSEELRVVDYPDDVNMILIVGL